MKSVLSKWFNEGIVKPHVWEPDTLAGGSWFEHSSPWISGSDTGVRLDSIYLNPETLAWEDTSTKSTMRTLKHEFGHVFANTTPLVYDYSQRETIADSYEGMCIDAQSPSPGTPAPPYNGDDDDFNYCQIQDAQRPIGRTYLDSIPTSFVFNQCAEGDAPSPPTGGMGEDGTWHCYDVYLDEWESNDGGFSWSYVDSSYLGTECWLYGSAYMQ